MMEMAVFYSKGGQYGAGPCFASAKQSFETVVASSRSETLNIPCKPPNLHVSWGAPQNAVEILQKAVKMARKCSRNGSTFCRNDYTPPYRILII